MAVEPLAHKANSRRREPIGLTGTAARQVAVSYR